jgi:drug/metabolite transporter (DMT)-like permease
MKTILSKNIGLISVFLAVFIWGATYVVTKIGLGSMGPNTLGFYRGFLGSLFLISIIAIQGQLTQFIEVFKKNWKTFALLGFVGITLSMIVQNTALTLTTAGLFSIILATMSPLFIALISIIFLKEKATRNKIIALILGLIGVSVILINRELFTNIGGFKSILGQLLSLATAAVWAIYSVQNKKFSKNISAIFLTTGAYLCGTLFLAPVSIIFENPLVFLNFNLSSWIVISFLGFISAGLAFFLWAFGFTKIEASKAGMFMYLIPVVSLVLGWLLLRETLSFQAILGTAIILSGVVLLEKNS